jgi:hypothetical protein
MMNDGDEVTMGGTDGPAAAEEIDLVIMIRAATGMDSEVEVQEAAFGRGA